MSDTLIKGMEMPKEGNWITLRVFPDGQCFLYSWCGNDFDFMEHLTAATVPEHGRLIDEKDICDKIRPLIENPYCYNRLQVISETLGYCLQIVRDAPTVIEAEEGE